MNELTLTGGLAWIVNICILATIGSIVLLGTWCIFNYIIFILFQYSMRFFKMWGNFLNFCKYHKRYLKWAKKYEGKMEEGAND